MRELGPELSYSEGSIKSYFKNASGPSNSRVSMADISRKHISFDEDLKSILFYKNMLCLGVKGGSEEEEGDAYKITIWDLQDGAYRELSTKYVVLGYEDIVYGSHCMRSVGKYIPKNHPHQGRSVVVGIKYVVLGVSKDKSVYWASILQ